MYIYYIALVQYVAENDRNIILKAWTLLMYMHCNVYLDLFMFDSWYTNE